MSQTGETPKVQFISVADFKAKANVQSLRVLNNPHTKKDFLSLDNGQNMRCQNGISKDKPMQFIIDDADFAAGNWTEACLINYDDSKGATEKFSL